jgi:glycosyltransferase involved in cell wall biosynthesis
LDKNILFCSFYYKANLKTGANKRFENIISSITRHLKKDQKIIVLLKKGNISDSFIHDKIEVQEIPRLPLFDRFFTYILYCVKLVTLKKMIVVSDFMPVPIYSLSKHVHFQLIHDMRNFTKFRRFIFFSFGKMIQKSQWKKCQNIITVSNFTKKELVQKCDIKPENIFVSPNGIDTSYLNEPSIYDNRDIDILYVATFEKRKNHQLLIKAFEHYNGKETIKVCFIGKDLGTKNEIRSSVSSLDNNIMVSFVDNVNTEKEILGYYDRSKIFVSPSLYEGFGMPLVEALSRGCKVLCSDTEVFREVGSNYVEYFPTDDPSILLDLIMRNMKSKSRSIVDSDFLESYNWSKISRDLSTHFNVHL